MVEFVLVLPMLLLLIIGVVEFGRLMSDITVIRNVAYEVARRAATNGSDDDIRLLVETPVGSVVRNASTQTMSYSTDPATGKQVYQVRLGDDGDDEWVEFSVNPAFGHRVQGDPITVQGILRFKPIFTGWIFRSSFTFRMIAVSRAEYPPK